MGRGKCALFLARFAETHHLAARWNDGFRKKMRVKTRFFCSTHPTRGDALSLRHGAPKGVPELIDGAGAMAIAPYDIVPARLRQWPAAWQTCPNIREP